MQDGLQYPVTVWTFSKVPHRCYILFDFAFSFYFIIITITCYYYYFLVF